MVPEYDYEKQGMEDPRLVKIDNLFYLTYTAYDGINALGALATSTDLKKTWKKVGIIVPRITYEEFKHLSEDKDNLHDKYIRYNHFQISHQTNTDNVYLWSKKILCFSPEELMETSIFFTG